MMLPEELGEKENSELIDQLEGFYGQGNIFFALPQHIYGKILGRQLFTDRAEKTPDQLLAMMTPEERVYRHLFAGARSTADLLQVRAELKWEDTLSQNIESGPLNTMVGHALAGFTDPVNLIPFLGSGVRGLRAAQVGARVAGETAVSEAIFQGIQTDRSVYESLANVMVSGVFGAAVGAVAARGAKGAVREMQQASGEIEQLAQRQQARLYQDVAEDTDELSVGAREAWVENGNDTVASGTFGMRSAIEAAEKHGLNRAASALKATHRTLRKLIPSYEVGTSKLKNARRWMLRLSDPAIPVEGNFKNFANPENLYTNIRAGMANKHEANDALFAFHKEAAASGYTGGQRQFYEEVGEALHTGKKGSHPVVDQTADWMRKNIFDPLTKKADAVKLWPDLEIKFRNAPRMIDNTLLRVNSKQFDDAVANWLVEKLSKLDEKPSADQLRLDIPDPKADEFVPPDMDDALDAAAQIRAQYLRHPADRLPTNIKVKVTRNGRTVDILADDIPHEIISDFVVKDAQKMMNRFMSTMISDIETKRLFGELNIEATMEKELRAEADELKRAAKTPKEAKEIEDETDRMIEVLRHVYRRTRGVEGAPADKINMGLVKAGAIFRNLNFMRVGGSIVTGSVLPDAAGNVFVHGLSRALGGFVTEMANGFKGTKLSKAELRRAGDAWDHATASSLDELYDIGARYESGTVADTLERATSTGARGISRLQFLPKWNDMGKSFSGALGSTVILEAAEKMAAGLGHTISKRDRLNLNRAGISEQDLRAMAKEADAWERSGSLIFANTADWKNQSLAARFGKGLGNMARNSTITPNPSDTPNLMSTAGGMTLFQFKKFGVASTGRITMTAAARLRHGDLSVLNGVLALVAGGLMTTMTRDMLAHGELKERSPEEWLLAAVDRSGVLSMLMEAEGLTRAMTGRSIFGQPVSRFAGRGRAGVLGGPVAGFVTDDLGDAFTTWADGEWNKKDAKKLMRLLPGNNLPAINGMVNALAR